MNRLVLFASLLALAGCRQVSLGLCAADADCPSGSRCDPTQSPAVCTIPQGGCFPSCEAGMACRDGQCVPPVCTPACDLLHVCDPATATCVPVTEANVGVTSPGAGHWTSATLQLTASARAPGGVSAVRFELRRGADVLTSAAGSAAPTTADPANWAATLTIPAGVADGSATVVALATHPAGVAASAAVQVGVDLTAPQIAMVTDGRAAWVGAGARTISATVTDAASGPASATLTLGANERTAQGTLTGTAATFTVIVDDALAAAGTSREVALRVVGRDAAGNTATLSGAPEQVLRIDREPPSAAAAADTSWHAGSTTITLDGTSGDAQSLAGGAVAVLRGATTVATGTLTPSSDGKSAAWSAQVGLPSLDLGPFEGAVDFSVRVTDQAGNAVTAAAPRNVDHRGPAVSAVAITQSPQWTSPDGRAFFGPGANLTVQARITDASGVENGTVCLRVAGETAACPHAGARSGNDWTFALPRPAAATLDGSAPLAWTIEADDRLRATLNGDAAHRTQSAQQTWFDTVGPSIAIAADSGRYSRTNADGSPDLIPVRATIADVVGADAAAAVLRVAATSFPATATEPGGVAVLSLDATRHPAGSQGLLAFEVRASDFVGNAASATGARYIDAAPPLFDVRIWRDTPPAADGVAYPPAITDTGWDGGTFVYSDVVHVSGTLADDGGIAAAPKLRLDGFALDGGTDRGVPVELPCGPGVQTCTFDVTLRLAAAGNGRLHTPYTGTNDRADRELRVVVEAADLTTSADGGAVPNAGADTTGVRATRFWWKHTLAADYDPSALALHPNGDVIVTTTRPAGCPTCDSVRAYHGDGPIPASGTTPKSAVRWTWGGDAGTPTDAGIGDVLDAPSIGAGDAASAPIYVASSNRALAALNPDGTVRWYAGNLQTFWTAPAVADTTITLTGGETATVEAAVVASYTTSAQNRLYAAYRAPGAAAPTVVTANAPGEDPDSSPLVLGDSVYYGAIDGSTTGWAVRHTFTGGALGSATTLSSLRFRSPLSDGVWTYWPTENAITTGRILQLGPTFAAGFNHALPTNARVGSDASLDVTGDLLFPDNASRVYRLTSGNVRTTYAQSIGGNGRVPIVGADGRVYTTRASGYLLAFEEGAVSWAFDLPDTARRAGSIDCDGHLYVLTDRAIYAFVTDDEGLGDSPWPTYRRDGRNSGNAGRPRYGSRSAAGCQQ